MSKTVQRNYNWFIGQVPIGQNQFKDDTKWDDAFGERVKVRIPGKQYANIVTDDKLYWAIVAKPTSQSNYSGGSTHLWGGEWVLGFFLDDECQKPMITHVLGNNMTHFDIKEAENGMTAFKRVNRFNGNMNATAHQIIGSSTKGQARPSKSDIDKAKTDNQQKTDYINATETESGIGRDYEVTTDEEGNTIYTVDNPGGGKSSYSYPPGSQPLPSTLETFKEKQMFAFNSTMQQEAFQRGDQETSSYYANINAGRDKNW